MVASDMSPSSHVPKLGDIVARPAAASDRPSMKHNHHRTTCGCAANHWDIGYMYICIYVNMYICIYVYMYICIYVYMYMCIYVYMYICIYVYMYICIYVYMYICIYVYMYICVYVYMCICICICICMYQQCLQLQYTLYTVSTNQLSSNGRFLPTSSRFEIAITFPSEVFSAVDVCLNFYQI